MNSQTPKTESRKINLAPNCSELIHLYKDHAASVVKDVYRLVRQKKPFLINGRKPNKLNKIQYIEFMRELGLPSNHKHSDFPFLEGVNID